LGLSAALLISMPQKASAQIIYACTNNVNGLLYIVAANATCPPNWTLLSWPSAPLIVGTVNANGTSQTPTTKFTITHPAPGNYVITFDPSVFGNVIPACIVMPLGLATVAQILENVSFCNFTIVNLSGVPTDTVFNFFAAEITH
jgi:hypothetical protein